MALTSSLQTLRVIGTMEFRIWSKKDHILYVTWKTSWVLGKSTWIFLQQNLIILILNGIKNINSFLWVHFRCWWQKKILVGTGFDHQLQFQKKFSFQRFLDIRFVYKGSSSSSETRHEGMILGVKFTFDKEKATS